MSALMTLHFFFREVRWTSNSSLLVLWVAMSLAIDLAPYMVIIILTVLGGRYGGRSLISFIITAGGCYCAYDLLGRFYTVYLFPNKWGAVAMLCMPVSGSMISMIIAG